MHKKWMFLALLSIAPLMIHCPGDEKSKTEETKITPDNAEQEAETLLEEVENL